MEVQSEKHFITRSGWLRAAVLGANDGILSTTSLAIGIAAASDSRNPILLATLAGVVAGALSMAAGEYVSVSSQSDIEHSDLEREKIELITMPEEELAELAEIYINRGLEPELAKEVAIQLTAHNALEAHARDELGITEITQAKPFTAAAASALAFTIGGLLPVLVAMLAPLKYMVSHTICFSNYIFSFFGCIGSKSRRICPYEICTKNLHLGYTGNVRFCNCRLYFWRTDPLTQKIY